MLISFTFENWKSYGEENCLNLQAGSKKSHAEQLASLPSYPSLKILPLTAVYGSNASGKTNLFTALAFVKKYITQGPELHNNSLLEKPIKTIPVTPCHTGTINYTKNQHLSLLFLQHNNQTTYGTHETVKNITLQKQSMN